MPIHNADIARIFNQIADLLEIRDLEGFGETLEQKILQEVERRREGKKRIIWGGVRAAMNRLLVVASFGG